MRDIHYFADALNDVMQAREELEDAKSKCDYNWGYFCASEIDRLDNANHRLALALRDFVLSVVEESK